MKKRIIATVLAIMMLMSVTVIAEEETSQTVTATSVSMGNDRNIPFSNGYVGYCIDRGLHGTTVGEQFSPAKDTTAATNNPQDGSPAIDISQSLKIMFTQCFEFIFAKDEHNAYVVKDSLMANSVLGAAWYFSENQWPSGDTLTLTKAVKAYKDNNGPEIPDEGYQITLDNGDVITFYFMVLIPDNKDTQYFFAYKLGVNEAPSHEHDFTGDWKYDETNHWVECGCGEKKDVDAHDGGTATCVDKAVCKECSEAYGDVNKGNHTGETEVRDASEATEEKAGYTGDTYCKSCGELIKKGEEIPATHVHDYSDEWSSNGEDHWLECECGDKKDVNAHDGGTATCVDKAVCEECKEAYGDVNKENHTGETEIRDKVEAKEFEPGYTGDTYCKDCGELIEEGEEIPATHVHDYSDEWSSNDEDHWLECECGDKKDDNAHDGGTATCVDKAVCKECSETYGDVNKNNHTGETEVRDASEATEEKAGYTGDTYCKACDTLIKEGEDIPAIHKHSGGTATCVDKAVCEDCSEEYGDVDKENHTGETEVRNASEATEEKAGYTGDTYCKSCGELIKKGEEIPATHVHDYSDEWSSNDEDHWLECECGDKKDVNAHDGGTATCVDKAVCEDCSEEYGDVDKENHTGETEIRDKVEAKEFEPGYTGDTYCKDCGELIEEGEEIPATHVHDYSDEWSSNDEDHWLECECGDKKDVNAHDGGTATCVDKAVCEDCKEAYGDVDKANHTGETEVRNASEATEEKAGYTGDTYCKACDTLIKEGEDIPAIHKHSGGTATCVDKAVCEDCSESYGDVDKENHTGETEVRNASEATEEKAGYTGDTYCKACDTLIKEGEDIPAIHKHSGGTATCVDKAVCEECSEAYGDVNKDNHTGETEVRNASEATEEKAGYTGDTYCKACDTLIKEGEETPAIHKHSGGTATCVDKAVCEDCSETYGDVNKDNHTGETEVRDASEATEFETGYSGDTYCKDCDTLLEEGTVIPATHIHKYGQTWHTDSSTHWKECECGEISEEAAHTYDSGSCTVCEKKDPSIDYAPATGDDSMIFMWLMLTGLSTAGIIFITDKRRKNSEV